MSQGRPLKHSNASKMQCGRGSTRKSDAACAHESVAVSDLDSAHNATSVDKEEQLYESTNVLTANRRRDNNAILSSPRAFVLYGHHRGIVSFSRGSDTQSQHVQAVT